MRKALSRGDVLAVLTAGGECPGIGKLVKVIYGRANRLGLRVLGIRHGIDGLLRRPVDFVELSESSFASVGIWPGSPLGMSRTGFVDTPEYIGPTLDALKKLRVNGLVTIGGDDTLTSACKLEACAPEHGMDIRIVHAPKSIDNDPPLPNGIDTFGFDTATEFASEQLLNLLGDFGSRKGIYGIVEMMGRSAGFYAFSSARKAYLRAKSALKARGCFFEEPFVFVPEMFEKRISLDQLVDLFVEAVLRSERRVSSGTAIIPKVIVLSEGVFERLTEESKRAFGDLKKDENGNTDLTSISLGGVLARRVRNSLEAKGEGVGVRLVEIGYTTRTHLRLTREDEIYISSLGKALVDHLVSCDPDGLVYTSDFFKRDCIPFGSIPFDERGKVVTRTLDLGAKEVAEFLRPSLELAP